MTIAPIDLFARALYFRPDGKVSEGERRMAGGSDGWHLGVFHVESDADLHADHWEMHPDSEEAVCCLSGSLRLYLRPERDGEPETTVHLTAGTATIVPRGRWHRLTLDEPSDIMSIGIRAGSKLERVAGDNHTRE